MKKQRIRTYRSESLPLQPLKIVLSRARKRSPPRVSNVDLNEELALTLIEKMKTQYKKYLPFIG